MMTREELEDARIQAETAKFQAETDKLRRETEAAQRTLWRRLGDSLKVFAAVFGTLIASVAAVTTYRVIQLETKLAEKERAEVEAEKKRLERERDDVAKDLALKSAGKQQAESALAAAQNRLAEIERELSKATPTSAPSVVATSLREAKTALNRAPVPVAIKPFVYIVPAAESQAAKATELSKLFQTEGMETYVTKPFQNSDRAPRATEVRYFRNPADRDEAARILGRIERAGVTAGRVLYLDDKDITRDRYYEIRLPRPSPFAIYPWSR